MLRAAFLAACLPTVSEQKARKASFCEGILSCCLSAFTQEWLLAHRRYNSK